MAGFSCPYCSHALTSADHPGAEESGAPAKGQVDPGAKLERCPSCDGSLLIAYRHRLLSSHGKISGGELYQAIDDGFGERVAVLFVEDQGDAAAVERFIEGSRLFADLGGRGLVKIHDVGTHSDRRAYVVMDWIEGGTLDAVVERRGSLDQAALLVLVGDLLTGMSKAHRSMPAIVHGHIHPGKIGFRNNGEVVLFGFEWATQVNAQASHLADSFVANAQADEPRGPASDLRQLAIVFYYAATAEWLGDQKLDRQRECVREKLVGPLGRLVDRMLGAGDDGYKSAVDAAIDFEHLMRGVDSWQAPSKPLHDRSDDRMGTAWMADSPDDDEHEDDEHEDDEHDDGPFAPSPSPPPASPSIPRAPDWGTIAAQRQMQALAQAQAQAKPANSGRVVLFIFASVMVMGTCVAGILADTDDNPVPQPQLRAPRAVEAIPPQPVPSYELPEIPEPAIIEPPAGFPPPLAGSFSYKGKITGPEAFAGLELGERCDVWIEPNDGSLNCRWYIDCGKPKRRIYGGGEVGYSTCEVDDEGHPLRAQDEDDDAPDGAFLADFTTDPKMIILEDRWLEPPVRVIISIEDGGLHEGEVPKVKQAPRDSQEKIQERIDAGESPVIEAGVIADW
jgi:serine/threonine protein kinase